MSIVNKEEVGGITGDYAQWTIIKGNFVIKARVFDTVLPAADTDLLVSDIEPTASPSYIRIYAAFTIVGVLSVMRDVGGNVVAEQLNNGAELTANAAYMFAVPWRTGDSINIQYSETGGDTLILDIIEAEGVE